MEQINAVELSDPNIYPDESVLKGILGNTYGVYVELLELFSNYDLICEWRYYKDGKAWLCKVQKGKRTIVWMSAWRGFMKATLYFPEKYAKGLFDLEIDEKTKERIMETANIGKSKPCTFEIMSANILAAMEKVIAYKIASK